MKGADLLHISWNNGKVFETEGKKYECESYGKSRQQRLSPFRHAVKRQSGHVTIHNEINYNSLKLRYRLLNLNEY